MFERPYSRLTSRISYKILIFLPIMFAILSLIVVYINGVPLSIDFQGGTWIDLLLSKSVDIKLLEKELSAKGLKDLRVSTGTDIETKKERVTIVTTTLLNETEVKDILKPLVNEEFLDRDIAIIKIPVKLNEKNEENLKKRFSGKAEISFEDSTLKFSGFDLNKEEIASAVRYYANSSEFTIDLRERNLIIDDFDPLLGKDFWNQSIRVFIIATLLMMLVVFIAFRDIIASFAVIISGFIDVVIALAGMSIFSIQFEPASLVALITLIGYCVDTNILLTARIMKTKFGDVNERIDNTFPTGMTMTITTLIVMAVIILFSMTIVHSAGVTQIAKLNTIALVLFLGLVADIGSTWLTCTGIMKWYLEEKGGKFSIFKKK